MVSALTTPVVLIFFNPPERTAEVFATIRAARPAQLFVIADGPRLIRKSDASKCSAARAIIEQVDWPYQILRRFSEHNIGLRQNVSEGLDWVFSQVKQAIILEDDCLPDSSFFPFCETLLGRYAPDREVAMIGADAVPVASSERKIVNATADRYVQENFFEGNYSLATFILEAAPAVANLARAPRAALARPLR